MSNTLPPLIISSKEMRNLRNGPNMDTVQYDGFNYQFNFLRGYYERLNLELARTVQNSPITYSNKRKSDEINQTVQRTVSITVKRTIPNKIVSDDKLALIEQECPGIVKKITYITAEKNNGVIIKKTKTKSQFMKPISWNEFKSLGGATGYPSRAELLNKFPTGFNTVNNKTKVSETDFHPFLLKSINSINSIIPDSIKAQTFVAERTTVLFVSESGIERSDSNEIKLISWQTYDSLDRTNEFPLIEKNYYIFQLLPSLKTIVDSIN